MNRIGAQLIQPDLALAWFMLSIRAYNLDRQTIETLERTYVGSLYLAISNGTEPSNKEEWMINVMRNASNRTDEVIAQAQAFQQTSEEDPL